MAGAPPEPAAGLAEADDAGRLRHADWRFLLPGPPRARRAACFARGPLRATCDLVADVVCGTDAAPGSCDLVVADDARSATLAAAVRALGPGGRLYLEMRWPLGGTARGLCRRLRSLGFERVAAYWAWPPRAGRAQVWLPLLAPRVVAWYARGRPLPRRPLARAVRQGAQAAWLTAARLGWVWPLRVVARLGGADPASGDEDPLDLARASLPADPAAEGPVARILLTGGSRPGNKVVSLLVAERSGRPLLAVKQARAPAYEAPLAREAEALRSIHASLPHASGVPRVVVERRVAHGGGLLVGQSLLEGQPLYARATRRTLPDLAARVTDWLATLVVQPRRLVPPHEAQRRLAGPILAEGRAALADVAPRAAFEATARLLARLPRLPVVVEQGDIWPGNVLVGADGSLAVMDWESARPSGLPAMDLLYFLALLAFSVEGARDVPSSVAVYRQALDPATPLGSVRAACLARYADRVGLSPRALRALRALVWLPHATWEQRHVPEAAASGHNLFVALWLVELDALEREPCPD